MKKKEMLNTLLEEYFNLRDIWDVFVEHERDLRKDSSFKEAERVHKFRIEYAQNCSTYEHIITTLFDVDAFQMWLDK